MSVSSHLDQFRNAVRKELSDEELRARRCDSFLEKIILYQSGKASLPDEQEFLLWREDLKKPCHCVHLKQRRICQSPMSGFSKCADASEILSVLMQPKRISNAA